MMRKSLLSMAVVAALLTGCAKEDAPAAPAGEMPAVDAASEAPAAVPEAEAAGASSPAAAATPFDVSTVAVSDLPLGEWPYVAAPEGYVLEGARTLDLSQVPFWTGQALQPVEGKVYEARIRADGEKTYSRFEVLKRVDQSMTAIGAHKVTTSEVPQAVIDAQLPKDFGVEFNTSSGGYYGGQEVSTYVLRRADRTVWFKVFSDANAGSLMIAEAEPAAPAS